MADTFTGWVRDVLEFAHDEQRRNAGRDAIAIYLMERIEERRDDPGDDLISVLLHTEVEGAPVPDIHVLGTAALTLIAGVDTTWSGIGSALWHLATHDDDRRRLVAEPELHADRDRGAPAGLLAGDDGPHRDERRHCRWLPDEDAATGCS